MRFSYFIAASLAGIPLSSAQFAANVPVDTRSLDEIYAAAQKEDGKLVVLSGGDAVSQGSSYLTSWAARFPKISLNLTFDLSKYHDSRVDRDFYAGKEHTDVVILQTLHDFPRWKEQNRLLYYKPSTFDDIYSGEKDLDGAYLPIGIFGFGNFIYDNTKLNASQVPSSYEELADPKWKGKLVMTYPNDDDAIAYLFSIIVSRYGFEWLDKVAANNVHWVRGTATPVYYLNLYHGNSSYTPALTITSASPGNASYISMKSPVAPEQRMTWAQTAGIFASTKRPETSKLFMSWLLNYDRANSSSTSGPVVLESLNYNTPNAANHVYGSNITQTTGFRVFMNNRRTVEWWKLQFETTLGPAQGPSPLTFVN